MSRILLLDDEPDLLLALSVRLTAAGFGCETARNGAEGLAKLQQATPDVIITDLIMPQMNGYEFVRQLKAVPKTAAIPIIALTAVQKQTLEPRAQELAGTRVMFKPFEFEKLVALIRELAESTTPREGRAHG